MYEDKSGSGWLEFRLFDEHQRDQGWILLVCHIERIQLDLVSSSRLQNEC